MGSKAGHPRNGGPEPVAGTGSAIDAGSESSTSIKDKGYNHANRRGRMVAHAKNGGERKGVLRTGAGAVLIFDL